MAIIKPHSDKQESALFSEKKITVVGTGTQWGKTTVGAVRMKMKLFTYKNKDDAFLITAPDYKTMMQSTLRAFLPMVNGWGKYNRKFECFELHKGGTVYFRTETHPDSIVGITNVRHIWGDEAGKYRLYFWENMQARADFLGASIDLTTSPYSLNWVWRDIIKPWRAGRRTDVNVIQAASWESPYHSLHDPKKREEKRHTMDPRRFQMLYGGEFGQMAGLVYDAFDEKENISEPFKFPTGTRFVAGIDWGFTDPFVLKVRAITPDGYHFDVSEFYQTGLTITKIIEICRQKKAVYPIDLFYCGPDQPGYIEELNLAGIPATKADNDIRRGIDLHYELIKTRKYKIFKGSCPYTLDEIEMYHYPEIEDLGPDDESKDQLPVGQNDHCMDVDRYITLMTYRTELKAVPKLPSEITFPQNETYEQRYRRLTARKRAYEE